MSDRRCEDCGEFFNHAMSTNKAGRVRHTHGIGPKPCERAAEVRAAMPALYGMTIQSAVEAQDRIGRFLTEVDDGTWNDPKALQGVLLDAYELTSQGVEAESRWRKSLLGAGS